MAGNALERELIDDRRYWSDPSADRRTSASPTVFLLPNYDEYFIGFKDRSAIAERLKSADLVTGGDALIGNVIVVDGQLVGGWKRALEKESVTVDLKLLSRLTRAEHRALRSAVESYGRYLGLRAKLSIAA